VGFIDTINALDLSDEVKQQMIREHESEVAPLQDDLTARRARDKKINVETEVTALSDLIGNEQVGALKFYRQVLLSDDEEPGVVLLSDDDLHLEGDQRVGASGKREISTAAALKEFVGLMRTSAKNGRVDLSDKVELADVSHDRPDNDDNSTPAARSEQARRGIEKATGQVVPARTRSRYSGGRSVVVSGGDS
jgi:hypothetical protein